MEKIGKYEIVRKIGQGGFGIVFEGRDPFIKRRVAIKTCSTEDEEIRKRFFREAEIAGNLQHRHVVTVFDLGVQDGVPYLVQEYLPGEDLSHKIKRQDRIDEYTRLAYLVEIAEGLEYAHSQGVVHRDVKPSNIRILDDGSVKIMDFGIAKLASAETQLTHTGMAMGTAGYLPPEQIRGEKVDLRADIFSYGVLAYELMAGVRPFRGENMSAVLFQIIGQDPEPISTVWPECPPILERIIHRCLAKNPADRYSSLTPLIAELKPLRDEARSRSSVRTAEPLSPDQPTQIAASIPTEAQAESLRTLERRLRGIIEKGDITAAELELTIARRKHGESESFSLIFDPLVRQIEEIRRAWEQQRQRTEKLGALLERARNLKSAGEIDEAHLAAEAALEVDPKSDEARALVRSLGEAIARAREAERQKKAVAAAVQKADQMLAAGQIAEAEAVLFDAQRHLGAIPAFTDAQHRVDLAKKRYSEGVASALLQNALDYERTGQLSEAQDVLRRALRECPGHAEVQHVLARLTAAIQQRSAEEQRQKTVDAAMASIESALASGDLKNAEAALKHHEKELGTGPFRALRAQWRAATEQQALAERQPATPSADVSGQTQALSSLTTPRSPTLPLALVAGGAGLVLLLAVGGLGIYWMSRPSGATPTPTTSVVTPSPEPTPETPPVTLTAGILAIDALPWGEVTEIVDANGRVIALPAVRTTPFTLSVPAGEYKVTVRNPRHPEPISLTAEVTSSGGSAIAEFSRVDAAAYLRKVGL